MRREGMDMRGRILYLNRDKLGLKIERYARPHRFRYFPRCNTCKFFRFGA